MRTEESRSNIQTICLLVLTAAVVTYLIYWLRPVLVPLVVAIFVVSGVGPILKTLEYRLGVTRVVAAGLTFLAGVAILVVFGCSLWISVGDLSRNAPAYRGRVTELATKVERKVNQLTKVVESSLHISLSPAEVDEEAAASPHKVKEEKITEFVDTLTRDGIAVVSQTLIHLVSTSLIVLIYVFFLLLGTPTEMNHTETWRDVDHQIRSFLALKTVISIFTGFAFGMALQLFGVPMALTFGVLAFLLNFIPNVGPLAASLLPIPLIILDPERSAFWMVGVIGVTSGIQLISGNVIEPKLMGESSDLHPVTVLAALMFWGMMWGIIGMFLATPIMAGLKIVFERFEATQPVAAIMAGRLPRQPPGATVAPE
jgi:AI-2 transport protein TqsA